MSRLEKLIRLHLKWADEAFDAKFYRVSQQHVLEASLLFELNRLGFSPKIVKELDEHLAIIADALETRCGLVTL